MNNADPNLIKQIGSIAVTIVLLPVALFVILNTHVLALVFLTLAGCASTPMKTISIDSDPQGVRVECNNEDLGKTPTTFTVRTNPEGEFLGAWAGGPMVQFTA